MLLGNVLERNGKKMQNFEVIFGCPFLPHQVHLSPLAILPCSLTACSPYWCFFSYLPLMITYLISSVFSSASFPCFSTFPSCNWVESFVLLSRLVLFLWYGSLSLFPSFFSTPFPCHFLSSPPPLCLSPSFFAYFSCLSHNLQLNLSIFKPSFLLFFL